MTVTIPPASPTTATVVLDLPLDLLVPNPNNPRRDVGDVTSLADSIRSVGLLEPLVVVPADVYRAGIAEPTVDMEDGRYVLIAGHRRLAAATQAGLTEVPCVVRTDLTGAQARLAMLLENLERSDLTVIEEAQAYAELRDLGVQQEEIARRVGRSQSHISKRLDLLKLPDEGLQLVLDKRITLDEARALVPLADQPKALLDVVNNRPSYQDVKAAVDDRLKKQADKTKYEQAVAELKAKGVRVVKCPQYNEWASLRPRESLRPDASQWEREQHEKNTKRPAKVKELVERGRIKSAAAHRKLSCHAVAVVSAGAQQWSSDSAKVGDVVEACSDWTTHALAEETEQDAQRAALEAEQREYEAAVAAHRDARDQHARRLVQGKPAKKLVESLTDYALRSVFRDLTRVGYGVKLRQAADFLGLGAFDTEGQAQTAVLAHADKHGLSVVVAACLLQQGLTSGYAELQDDALALLDATGYTPPGPAPVAPGEKPRTPQQWTRGQRVRLLPVEDNVTGIITESEWSGEQWLYEVAIEGEGNGTDANVPEDEITLIEDGGPDGPADDDDETTGLACQDCGCTIDGPCDQQDHCADADGYATCSLVEGDVRCSACEPAAAPAVEDVQVTGGQL